VVLVFGLGPAMRVGGDAFGPFVAGLGTSPADTEHPGASFGIQVDLPPLAASRVLAQPMDGFADRAVHMEDAIGPEVLALLERLHDAPQWEERFDVVDGWLRARLDRGPEPPPAIAWACGELERSGGRLRIGALATELGCSRRYLVAQFRRHVGLPPKGYARVLRFRRALRRLRGSGKVRLDDVALSTGYFDQAHMNREFVRLAGVTPGRILADRTAPVTFVQV
jgi:AraC-like DNA-binding protein